MPKPLKAPADVPGSPTSLQETCTLASGRREPEWELFTAERRARPPAGSPGPEAPAGSMGPAGPLGLGPRRRQLPCDVRRNQPMSSLACGGFVQSSPTLMAVLVQLCIWGHRSPHPQVDGFARARFRPHESDSPIRSDVSTRPGSFLCTPV